MLASTGPVGSGFFAPWGVALNFAFWGKGLATNVKESEVKYLGLLAKVNVPWHFVFRHALWPGATRENHELRGSLQKKQRRPVT